MISILLNIFFDTVEFYVIAAVIAAAVIAAAALPARRGAVRTFLYGGTLSEPRSADMPLSGQGIIAEIDDCCRMIVYRFGLDGVYSDGAYSLAVQIAGFDVTIKERLTSGSSCCPEMTRGQALLDCLGRERYHFQYISESTGRNCAFSLKIAPGNRIVRSLDP